MKKNILTIGAGVFLSSILLFTACKETEDTKDSLENTAANASYTSTQDNSDAEKKFDEIHRIVEEEVKNGETSSSSERLAGDCGTVSIDLANQTITIDYGTEGCTDTYQNTHKGKITITYTGKYLDSNTVITTTLDEYYLNGDKVEGTKVVKNKGKVDGKQTFEVKVTDGKISYEDGKTATWTSTRTRVLSDEGTILPFDEVYDIYGTAEGVNTEGLTYVMNVAETTPIVIDMKCWLEGTKLPKSGIMTITPEGLETRTIDYGDGTCDRAVTVSIGSLSKELSL